MTPDTRVRVGVLGCGSVGSALVRLVHDHADVIEARSGVPLEITRVAVRDHPPAPTVRERGAAAQPAPAPDASPRPVRPLRRRVAAPTEASVAAHARLQQGDESLREGRLFEALIAFREALETDPSFAAAARRLGDAYREHHDTALAIATRR